MKQSSIFYVFVMISMFSIGLPIIGMMTPQEEFETRKMIEQLRLKILLRINESSNDPYEVQVCNAECRKYSDLQLALMKKIERHQLLSEQAQVEGTQLNQPKLHKFQLINQSDQLASVWIPVGNSHWQPGIKRTGENVTFYAIEDYIYVYTSAGAFVLIPGNDQLKIAREASAEQQKEMDWKIYTVIPYDASTNYFEINVKPDGKIDVIKH